MATTQLFTIADLEEMEPVDGVHYELIRGDLIRVAAAGGRHGQIVVQLGLFIGNFVTGRQLGRLYSSETGFVLERNADTLLESDIAFVRTARLPPEDERVAVMELPPNLVVEVRSPTDRPGHISRKIALYLETGVPLVCDVQPKRRTVRVHAADQPVQELGEDQFLDGGDVLPGFRVRIADIFR